MQHSPQQVQRAYDVSTSLFHNDCCPLLLLAGLLNMYFDDGAAFNTAGVYNVLDIDSLPVYLTII